MRLAVERLGFPRWQYQPTLLEHEDANPPIVIGDRASRDAVPSVSASMGFGMGQNAQFRGQLNTYNPWFRKSFSEVLTGLGLTTNLKLCLDAGDILSWPKSPTKWLDRSGGGYDFDLGTSSTGEAADPAYQGVPGRKTKGEFFEFDGAKYFQYDAANEAWMENCHKNNALFSVLMWVRVGSISANSSLIGTNGGNAAVGTGWHIAQTNSGDGHLLFRSVNAGSAAINIETTTAIVAANTMCLVSLSVDEAAGASGGFFGVNTTFETFTSTYASPAAGGASRVLEIGARGNGDAPINSGSRLAGVMAWEGVALTQAQVTAVFNATRGRFGV